MAVVAGDAGNVLGSEAPEDDRVGLDVLPGLLDVAFVRVLVTLWTRWSVRSRRNSWIAATSTWPMASKGATERTFLAHSHSLRPLIAK